MCQQFHYFLKPQVFSCKDSVSGHSSLCVSAAPYSSPHVTLSAVLWLQANAIMKPTLPQAHWQKQELGSYGISSMLWWNNRTTLFKDLAFRDLQQLSGVTDRYHHLRCHPHKHTEESLHAGICSKCFSRIYSCYPHNTPQMRKLRHGEVKLLGQGHIATKS